MEEHIPRFKTLSAYYEQDGLALGGPHEICVNMRCGDIAYDVVVKQCRTREITAVAAEPIPWTNIQTPLFIIERLLMLFDGAFVPLVRAEFDGSPDGDDGEAEVRQVLARRLSYFDSDLRSSNIPNDKLVDYCDVLTDDLVGKWLYLVEQLDITNQMYLYAMSRSGMPIDIRCAFLIELAEPLIEMCNKERGLFPDLAAKNKPTLKECLDAVIGEFGKVAFAYEMQMGKKAYDAFLSKLKCSRVRIMHIKANQPKDEYLNGLESAFYLKKLSLMYRAILLDLLGVPANLYEKRLKHRVETLDNWFAENHRKL